MNFNLVDFSTYDELPPEIANNLGWIPDDLRNDEMKEAHFEAITQMPRFNIIGYAGIDTDKIFLWDACKAVNGGKHLLTTRQLIGSCVGHGGYNACRVLMCLDIFIRKDNEQFVEIFEPYGYGRSRFHAGIRGSGSGSTGSGMAKAARTDGVLRRDFSGLSGWDESADTITWSSDIDTRWSNGANIGENYLSEGRKYLVKTTAQVNSAADVKAAIQNGYPCTIASNWGGQMQCSVKEGVLLNKHVTSWGHQMSVHGWMLHQTFGDLYYIWNSWGANTHGVCPTGAPPGGFWVTDDDMDYITSQDDSFAFSQFDGFPAQKLNFNVIG